MVSYAYYNGDFGKREDIKIPLSDRSIFFGDAIYDAAIGRYEFIMWESEHIDRFLSNAERIGIKHSYTKSFLVALLREIAIKSCIPEYFIYMQISRSKEMRTHSGVGCSANLLITIEPFEINNSPPLKLALYDDKRYGYCNIKTVNLLPSVLASTEAEQRGCDEAVFVRDGLVTECAKSNVSILKNGILKTHPTNNRILPGIARRHLLLSCEKLGIPYIEEAFTIEELFTADEILVTSTTKLCKRANILDGQSVGMYDGKNAEKICQFLYKKFAFLGKN